MIKNLREKHHLKLLAGVSAYSLLMMTPQASYAQDADKDDDDDIEELIVIGTKSASNIQDVAQSITAISGETIEKEGLMNLADYARSIPSLTFYALQPGRNQIVFRGVSTGTDEFRTDSSTSVYFDEQPMTAISQQIDPRMVDIQRIEALPGPQGTLFGSSSQSGTIRFITNKPDTSGFGGQVEASVGFTKGGEASYDINGVLNIPLTDDLAVRAVGFKVQDGGYIDNVFGTGLTGSYDNSDVVEDDFNDWGVYGGRLSAKWDVSDTWSVLATGMYEKSESNGDWKTDPSAGDYAIVRFRDDFRNDEWWSAALTIRGDLGFADLVSATTYLDRKISYEWDGSTYDAWRSSYYETFGNYAAYYALQETGDRKSYTYNNQTQKRFTQEIRLSSKGDSRFQWMVGGFYEKVEDDWDWGTKVPDYFSTKSYASANYWSCYYAYYEPAFQCPLKSGDRYYSQLYDRTVSQVAVFGELSYNFTDNLMAVFGARWFEFERDRTEINQWPFGLPPEGVTGDFYGGTDIIQAKNNDTVYKFGLEYRIDDDRMVYFNYSEGFRLGGVNSLRAANTGFVPREYGPDTLTNYEAGLKSQWLDDRLTLNLSVFRMEWQDIQRSVWSNSVWWLNGNVNGGEAVSKGFEGSMWAQVTPRLTFNANLFLSDAKLKDPILNSDGSIGVAAGTDLTFAPSSKYSFGFEYTIPDAMWGADFWVRYDFWGQASQLQNQYTGLVIPSYNESNLTAGLWKEGDWDGTLAIYNLFDQRNISSIDEGDNYAADYFGTNMYRNMQNVNRPRTLWLTVRKRF
ncbi:TonB-dependent receptor [Temperatibacter marinus]|uniref:TonB-dependent receptor n=1 Tax=Temperatibacter marinus TaxID=1456591 RepID=A0AA52HAE5_9PROT|nr:TonB-dependent receptor [Temperatibacter marinus]WND03879.1 TonB-dependent receptor [Temperatibacter marinus]